MNDPDPTAPPRPRPGGGGLALTGICLGFFLVLFDATAVNVATGGIAAGLGASVVAVQWVLNAYTVAFAAFMLAAGNLGDRWGARRVYLGGSVVFALASAACAVAPTAPLLIAARAVQGLGAAAVVPCSLALIAHRFPEPRQRSWALGIWGGVSGIGLAAGPVLGGGLVSLFGWPSVFLVVVPIAAVSIGIVATRIGETPRASVTRHDLVGQVLTVIALIALTAALTETSTLGWGHPLVIGLLVLAVVAGVAFVVVERSVAEPILPPALFASARFSGAVSVGLLFNLGLYGVLFCFALVLERAQRESTAIAGLAMLPLTAVVAVGALQSGRLSARFGARTPMLLGLGGGLVGSLLLAVLGDGSGALAVAGMGAVLGLVGLAMPAMTGVALTAAGAQRAGVGAAVLNAARQAGGALGVALLGSSAFAHAAGADDLPRFATPMLVAAAGYLVAIVLTATTIRADHTD